MARMHLYQVADGRLAVLDVSAPTAGEVLVDLAARERLAVGHGPRRNGYGRWTMVGGSRSLEPSLNRWRGLRWRRSLEAQSRGGMAVVGHAHLGRVLPRAGMRGQFA